MFGRPRCREWTPLATQQLRLRSLIQIVGYNIRPPEDWHSQCSFYVTLHHTAMSAPFYTSERISSPHPKWKEIDSEITQCMSSTNVILRIWCKCLNSQSEVDRTDTVQDTVIQTWGVYFSGLRYIGANVASNFTSDCFKSNTIVFQMHGGYYCSYKSLNLDVIPPEYEMEHGSLTSSSSNDTSSSTKITMESRFAQNHKIQSRSESPINKFMTDVYSKSHSPVERGFKRPLPKIRSFNSLSVSQIRDRRRDGSEERPPVTNEIYEHSPESMEVRVFTMTEKNCDIPKLASQEDVKPIDLSETAESYDLRNETSWTPKYRYLALNFLKSEIRPSYNATKLQKLHLLQYSIKKRQEAVQDIKERIYSKSALSQIDDLDEEQNLRFKLKSRSQRNLFSPEDDEVNEKSDLSSKNGRVKVEEKPVSNGPRLTLKLNDLLSFKSKPSPFQRSEQIRLTKQLEILRFKRIILVDERDSKLVNIRRLKETYNKLCEENQDVGTELMQAYHSLSRQAESLREASLSATAVREIAARSHAALQARRAELLQALLSIFNIEQGKSWQICSVPLGVCGEARHSPTPLSDSVAAGLAAQVTTVAAGLCALPLRYSVTLLGSCTRILDTAADLPSPEIPLFARGGDITLFRYAMFLLNKCIAQLMYARGLHVADMRPTLANLKRLLTAPVNVSDTAKLFGTYRWLDDSDHPRTQSLRSLVASERGKHSRQFNRFKETVDGQSPQSLISLRKHSRSVGSYNDDHELSSLNACSPNMGSEPNIYNSLTPSTELSAPAHSSESDITKIAEKDKVIFTLGDDDRLQSIASQLVKMSTNNHDELYLRNNVKTICDEIEHFCSDPKTSDLLRNDLSDSIENLDIAKYMSSTSVVKKDISEDLSNSNVQNIMVMPNAESESSIDHYDPKEVDQNET